MKNNDLYLEDVVNLELARGAIYFGLEVEVVIAMTYWCSIRYGNQDFVVLTEDLQLLDPTAALPQRDDLSMFGDASAI